MIKEMGNTHSPNGGNENQPVPSTSGASDTASLDYDGTIKQNGVPVVILHEGGYCATIVALMATRRLNFDIVIPEQIIMMDQQQPIMEDHQQSLLRRFSSHTQMSGRHIKDIDGPFVEHASTPSPSSASAVDRGDGPSKGPVSHVLNERLNSEKERFSGDEFSKVNVPVKRKAIGKDKDKVKKSKVDANASEAVNTLTTSFPEIDCSPQFSQTSGKESEEKARQEPYSTENLSPLAKTMNQGVKTKGSPIKDKQTALKEEGEEDIQETEDGSQAREVFSAEDDIDVIIPQVRISFVLSHQFRFIEDVALDGVT